MEPGKLKAALRTELDDVARRKALQGYEIPREFIVELHPFSKDNHLLTDSNKPARGQLKKRCATFESHASVHELLSLVVLITADVKTGDFYFGVARC